MSKINCMWAYPNCKRKAKTYELNGYTLQSYFCKVHEMRCWWDQGRCKRKKTKNWFCDLHYLAKEANYGLNDTDPDNKPENKRPGGHFYQWGVERLRTFAEYVIDEKII